MDAAMGVKEDRTRCPQGNNPVTRAGQTHSSPDPILHNRGSAREIIGHDVSRLVERAANGDEEAFASLVDQYHGMAFGYAFGTVRDRWLAEDASQIAFLEAYRNLRTIRDPARFGAWLRGILRYTCLRLMRDQPPWESLDAHPARLDLPVALLEQEDVVDSLDQLLAGIARLPETDRLVASLYYIDGGSQAEVARFLGLTTSMVNNRLRRARTRLRKEGVFPMKTPDIKRTHDGFVSGSGKGFIDVRIEGVRPALLDTVDFELGAGPIALVSQYISDDVVRLLPFDGTKIPEDASKLTLNSHSTQSTASKAMISALVNNRKQELGRTRVNTGIKALDVFAPVVANGIIAIVGDSQVGKLVLVEELLHRLDGTVPLTVLVFLAATGETAAVKPAAVRQGATIAVVYIPVQDASAHDLRSQIERCDAIIVMSSALASADIYPAIDVTLTRSGIQDDELTAKARSMADHAEPIRRFVAQPFHVAESFTGRPGTTISLNQAMQELAALVAVEAGSS